MTTSGYFSPLGEQVSVVEVFVPGLQGPVGPAGLPGNASTTYLHEQAVPSATWIINHNLGFKPDVYLTTLGGMEFQADVLHMSLNQTRVLALLPITGFARCT